MSRRIGRATVPLILGLILSAGLFSTAVASAPWIAECSGGGGSNYICVYSDRDLVGNRGHMSGSNASYIGQTYPSSSTSVNDSMSSGKNLYASKDVTWHHEVNNTGSGFCVNPNTAIVWVGLFNNDAFTSHQVANDNSAC